MGKTNKLSARFTQSHKPFYSILSALTFLITIKPIYMTYSVSTLLTRPDCEALINIANTERSDLAYRKTGLQRQHQSASTTSVSIQTDLAIAEAEIDALQTMLAAVTSGPVHEETLVKLRKAEYRQFLLVQRKGNYGPIALVEKEFDIARIDQSIAEADLFIAGVQARMNELPV